MDERELIKSKIDLVEFINSYVPLKKMGRNFRARCPFHNEKSPSFTVSPERQIWKCFGCQKAGDVFGFLMEYEKMGFGEAIRMLAEKTGVKLEFRGKVGVGGRGEEKEERETLFEINHLTSEFYNYVLLKTEFGKDAREYLEKRGIIKESINLFKIGYAPNSFQSLVNFLRKKGYKSEELVKSGVAVGSGENLKDRFYGRLMFTLFDHRGNVVGFAGRVFQKKDEELVKAGITGKYINTSETPVYHKSEVLFGFNMTKDFVRKEDFAIVVEGEIDLIKVFQAGTKNVVAIKGSAFTEQQVALLKRFTQNLKICLDSDLAGQMAAMRGIAIAEKADFNIKIVELLEGKDPDECVSKDIKIWKKSLSGARDVWQFYIDIALKQFDVKDTFGKKNFTEFVFPKINEIANLVVRDHYVKKLAGILEVDEEVVLRQMEEVGKKRRIHEYTKTGRQGNQNGRIDESMNKERKNRREQLEENLVALILQSDDAKRYLAASAGNKVAASDAVSFADNKVATSDVANILNIKTPVLKKIYDKLIEFVENDVFTIQNFVMKLPEELRDKTDELYLKDLGFENLLESLEKEIGQTVLEISKLDLKEKIDEILAKMRQVDEEALEFGKLNEELQRLSGELKKINLS
jgi:DNA primase